MKKGTVYIAGVGPGDPGLLTIKVVSYLKDADLILYDHLINKDILKYAKPSAQLIYAGKMPGEHMKSQDEINGVLIKKALEGYKVLRLKGGDPFLFGRGAEEAVALAKEAINFEIIPGVSSVNAVPLYAGIPLTHRGLSSSVVIITGHRHTLEGIDEHDWDAIAKLDTIVVLMGVAQIKQIVQKLVNHGRDPDNPVAVIRWGTTPMQFTHIYSLKNIVEENHKPFTPPALIIIGKIVELRKDLNWFEHLPLFGKKILITRQEKDNIFLRQLLEELGAFVIEQPTIRLVEPDDYAPLDKAIKKLKTYDMIIFTSANAVTRFADRLWLLGKDIRSIGNAEILAIGPKTAHAVEEIRIRVDETPDEFKAEGLISLLTGRVKGKRILIPRAQEARMVLVNKLKEMGAEVDVVPVYKTIEAPIKQDVLPYLKEGIDLAVFASSSAVRNFFDMFGENALSILKYAGIACIGPVTAKTVEEMGFEVKIQPSSYTIEDLVEEITLNYMKKI